MRASSPSRTAATATAASRSTPAGAARQGLDALDAVKAVRDALFIVHLKDVQTAGGHETCALGDGVVPWKRLAAVTRHKKGHVRESS